MNPLAYVKGRIRQLDKVTALTRRLDLLQSAIGRVELRQCSAANSDEIAANEFKVYSQFGEDGIIQWLLRRVPTGARVFVEFGVEDYREANTRFLLVNDRWSGLVMDGSPENVRRIRRDPISWSNTLASECAFIDRDNVNRLIGGHGIQGDIGLLSVDVDGNDYWIWQAIDVISPRIVICEYNSLFGPSRAVTIPYDPAFVRSRAHYSQVYYGASISALTDLARSKGYSLVGSNRAGNNIFFVRDDVVGTLPVKSAEEAWVLSGFRESLGPDGRLTFLDHHAQRALIAAMPLVDVRSKLTITVGDLEPLP